MQRRTVIFYCLVFAGLLTAPFLAVSQSATEQIARIEVIRGQALAEVIIIPTTKDFVLTLGRSDIGILRF